MTVADIYLLKMTHCLRNDRNMIHHNLKKNHNTLCYSNYGYGKNAFTVADLTNNASIEYAI